LAFTVGGGLMALFINGSQDGSIGNTPISCSFNNSQISAASGGMLGLVDEIRISNTQRYTSNFTPPLKPFQSDGSTVFLWHADSGTQSGGFGTGEVPAGSTFSFSGSISYVDSPFP
ncbi:MAG: hypothetical protein ACXVCH_16050, partial [Bdellovibrionota bacterium]